MRQPHYLHKKDDRLAFIFIDSATMEAEESLWSETFGESFQEYQYSFRLAVNHYLIIVKDQAGVPVHEVLEGAKKYNMSTRFYIIQMSQEIIASLLRRAKPRENAQVICYGAFKGCKDNIPYIHIAI